MSCCPTAMWVDSIKTLSPESKKRNLRKKDFNAQITNSQYLFTIAIITTFAHLENLSF